MYSALLEALGISLKTDLLDLALTHRSYAYESGGIPTNERLEFLGDSVLGLVVTQELYERLPEMDESKVWGDRELFEYFSISSSEESFIDTIVKEMKVEQ